MFRQIASDTFPPFGSLRMEFQPVAKKAADLAEVHLFTGVNGTGKTRLLAALAAMLGQPAPFAMRLQGLGKLVRIFASNQFDIPLQNWANFEAAIGGACRWVQNAGIVQWCQSVPAFAYSGNVYIADSQIAVMAGVPRPDRAACLSFIRPPDHSKSLLQAITNLKIQAAMDSMNPPPASGLATRSILLIKALESTLSNITGMEFRFQVDTHPNMSIGVSWGGKSLPFNLLPDGLLSIIGWLVHAVVMMDAWLQGQGNPMETEAVFLLDEIEGHLHPAWQRRVLPAFQRLFPKSQIFVATHSPFVIASLHHGWIHPLTLGTDGVVKVEAPVEAHDGDSYISVVEDIMGLKEWFDPETETLLAKFRAKRDAAYHGDAAAKSDVHELAKQLGGRSMELGYIMGRELSQMDRQLAEVATSR